MCVFALMQQPSLGGPMALGAIYVPYTAPDSLRIAQSISKATSLPTDVVNKAVSEAMQQEPSVMPRLSPSRLGATAKVHILAKLRVPQRSLSS